MVLSSALLGPLLFIPVLWPLRELHSFSPLLDPLVTCLWGSVFSSPWGLYSLIFTPTNNYLFSYLFILHCMSTNTDGSISVDKKQSPLLLTPRNGLTLENSTLPTRDPHQQLGQSG